MLLSDREWGFCQAGIQVNLVRVYEMQKKNLQNYPDIYVGS